ncbi:hypothetical protein [uncultured Roseobacter sp.]|uniref:hypothetical protein n=1 Tax=uncultured Roseobacter sp. TaxID=114847 RepID=UPI002632C721|nr:hypothetical protein [uncultured Roseobacter sp.]
MYIWKEAMPMSSRSHIENNTAHCIRPVIAQNWPDTMESVICVSEFEINLSITRRRATSNTCSVE